MPKVQIPLDGAREFIAKEEIANLSDDAVVYMLHLSALAMAMVVEPDTPRSNEAKRAFAQISTALSSGEDGWPVPDAVKIEAKQIVENIFTLMPNIVH